jgi:hypothetical protein
MEKPCQLRQGFGIRQIILVPASGRGRAEEDVGCVWTFNDQVPSQSALQA